MFNSEQMHFYPSNDHVTHQWKGIHFGFQKSDESTRT